MLELYGYSVPSGYMGFIETEGRYMLFPTEGEYREYLNELEQEEKDSDENN